MNQLPSTSILPRRLFQQSKSALKRLAQSLTSSRRRANWMAYGEKWAVSKLEVQSDVIVLGGWAIMPPEWRDDMMITCNGHAANTRYPIARPDVAAAFPYSPDASESGFECKYRFPRPVRPGEAIEIACVHRSTGRPPAPDYYPHFLRVPHPDDPPIPETARRVRVINQEADDYFQLSGYLQFRRLEWAMQQAAGKSFADCGNILDWGCGCGRVSRYFQGRPAGTFIGADVDAENVAWCKNNLRFASFETLPLHPPTGFGSGLFDAVIGISVFTHLRESDQDEWLDELHRITRPGATLLLTVHGDSTMYRHPMNLTDEQKRIRKHHGIVDISNFLYDANLAEQDYYRETFHTEAYIRAHWGRHFDILDILPGIVGPQDLIVARRN